MRASPCCAGTPDASASIAVAKKPTMGLVRSMGPKGVVRGLAAFAGEQTRPKWMAMPWSSSNHGGDQPCAWLVGLRTSGDYSPRGEPTISPKAQLSKRISIEMFRTLFGTLTATGTRPRPQQLPGNLASATILPVALSVTTINGDLPTGFQSLYSSLVAP